MFTCGYCENQVKRVIVFGPLVIGESQAMLGNDGEIIFGSIIPILTINAEGYKQHATAKCPTCGYEGSITDFKPVRMCFLSNLPADRKIELFNREVWFNEAALPDIDLLLAARLRFPLELFREEA